MSSGACLLPGTDCVTPDAKARQPAAYQATNSQHTYYPYVKWYFKVVISRFLRIHTQDTFPTLFHLLTL